MISALLGSIGIAGFGGAIGVPVLAILGAFGLVFTGGLGFGALLFA